MKLKKLFYSILFSSSFILFIYLYIAQKVKEKYKSKEIKNKHWKYEELSKLFNNHKNMLLVNKKVNEEEEKEKEKEEENEKIKEENEIDKKCLIKELNTETLSLPLMLLNMDIFDKNLQNFIEILIKKEKKIRIATKSIRVPYLIYRIYEMTRKYEEDVLAGYMCFSVEEAKFLIECFPFFDDFLIAYPSTQPKDLFFFWYITVILKKNISLMIDSEEHVSNIHTFWIYQQSKLLQMCKQELTEQEYLTILERASSSKQNNNNNNNDDDNDDDKYSFKYVENESVFYEFSFNIYDIINMVPAKLCIDVDVSYKFLNNSIHLGANRSSINSLGDLRKLLKQITHKKYKSTIKIVGMMGYEAHVAGLCDENPNQIFIMNYLIKKFKKLSIKDIKVQRESYFDVITKEFGIKLDYFNGGGSGSINSSSDDNVLTEIAVGSGLLQSRLFDYYEENKHEAAFCFALQITRKPQITYKNNKIHSGIITCQSGGFAKASGSANMATTLDPSFFLPSSILCSTLPDEGFGEVQTPLTFKIRDDLDENDFIPSLSIGDPIFFRSTKAGEISEHFKEYYIVEQHQDDILTIKGTINTYRGLNQKFY